MSQVITKGVGDSVHFSFEIDNRIEMKGVEALKTMLERNTTMKTITLESLDDN